MQRSFLRQFIGELDFLLASVSLLAMTIVALVAVFYRFILVNPLIWSDEAVKLIFAWFCFSGMSVVAKYTRHLRVDIIDHFAGPRLGTVFRLFANTFVLGTTVLLFVYGIGLCITQAGNQFASMPISRAWSFSALPVGAVLVGYQLIGLLRADIRTFRTGTKEKENC